MATGDRKNKRKTYEQKRQCEYEKERENRPRGERTEAEKKQLVRNSLGYFGADIEIMKQDQAQFVTRRGRAA